MRSGQMEFKINGDWRTSKVLVDDTPLPVAVCELRVRAGEKATATIERAVRSGEETTVAGQFQSDDDKPGQTRRIFMQFNTSFVDSRVHLDGQEVPRCIEAWVRLEAGEPTRMGFTTLEKHSGDRRKVTGYLIDEPENLAKGEMR